MRAPVTVLTATIPGREEMLSRCVESVYMQTHEVAAHLVMAQSCTEGLLPQTHVALQLNSLLAAVSTDFVMRLDDDNTLLSDHIAAVSPYFPYYDVIYSFDANEDRPHEDCKEMVPQEELIYHLSMWNWIDGSAVAIRSGLLKMVLGWPISLLGLPDGVLAEDQACFYNLAKAGARFKCVPEMTWRYGTGDYDRSSDHL